MENSAPLSQQQSQDFTPVLPTPQVNSAPPKKRWSKKIFFTLFGLALAILGVSLISMRSMGLLSQNIPRPTSPQSTTSQEQESTPPSSLTPSLTSAEKMKAYQNTTNKFSLSHPLNLEPQETSYGLGVTNISFNDTVEKRDGIYQMLIFSKTIAGMIGQNFDTYYNMKTNTTTVIKDSEGNSQNFTKVRNRTVGEQRAFDYISTSSPPNPDIESDSGTYVEIGGNILIISTIESNRKELDAILATFKYPL